MKEWFLVVFIYISGAQAVVESPRGCLEKQEKDCFFGSVSKISDYSVANQAVFKIGKNTVLEKQGQLVSFHNGELLIDVESEYEIKIKDLKVEFNKGEYVLVHLNDTYFVRTLQGEAVVYFKEGRVQVTEGFELPLKENESMGLEKSPLRLIPIEEHLVLYSRLKKLSRSEIVKYTQNFKKKYENYKHWSSELNEKLVQRQIAAMHEEEQERKSKDLAKKQAQEKMRQRLYEKVFER